MNYNIFCTLFDSRYLDKGIVLYNSIKENCNDFKLYVFAMDDKAADVLIDMSLDSMIVVRTQDFFTQELIKVKQERSSAEFCWTCTPVTIDYVLRKFKEKVCTYIDADMRFYNSPTTIFEEMESLNKSVIIVEHRFPPQHYNKSVALHGKYCVEFNTFLNNKEGLDCLNWWKEACIAYCHYSKDPKKCVGDQSYLEEFEKRFKGVLSSSCLGAGVAPWNISQYKFIEDEGLYYVSDNHNRFPLVFYHYQNIRYMIGSFVNINAGTSNKDVINKLYIPYLQEIEEVRSFLYKKYNIRFSVKKAVYRNPILRFIQNYIMIFKVRRLSDIVNIKQQGRGKNDTM